MAFKQATWWTDHATERYQDGESTSYSFGSETIQMTRIKINVPWSWKEMLKLEILNYSNILINFLSITVFWLLFGVSYRLLLPSVQHTIAYPFILSYRIEQTPSIILVVRNLETVVFCGTSLHYNIIDRFFHQYDHEVWMRLDRLYFWITTPVTEFSATCCYGICREIQKY